MGNLSAKEVCEDRLIHNPKMSSGRWKETRNVDLALGALMSENYEEFEYYISKITKIYKDVSAFAIILYEFESGKFNSGIPMKYIKIILDLAIKNYETPFVWDFLGLIHGNDLVRSDEQPWDQLYLVDFFEKYPESLEICIKARVFGIWWSDPLYRKTINALHKEFKILFPVYLDMLIPKYEFNIFNTIVYYIKGLKPGIKVNQLEMLFQRAIQIQDGRSAKLLLKFVNDMNIIDGDLFSFFKDRPTLFNQVQILTEI